MSLTIPFTELEQERLRAAAKQTGLAPEELVKRLTLDHLPGAAADAEENLDTKLRRWQEEDGTPLLPDVSTEVLEAQWAEEYANMTDEEREEEDRIAREVEEAILKNPGLQLRRVDL